MPLRGVGGGEWEGSRPRLPLAAPARVPEMFLAPCKPHRSRVCHRSLSQDSSEVAFPRSAPKELPQSQDSKDQGQISQSPWHLLQGRWGL